MGGRNANTGLGDWNQFDVSLNNNAKDTDAGWFSGQGGTQQQYEGMTPDQRAQYLDIMQHHRDPQSVKAFIDSLSSGAASTPSQGGAAVPGATPNAGDPTVSNSYMQTATPNVSNAWGSSGWSQDPKTGQWTQSSSPSGQLGDANFGLQTLYADNLAKGLGTGDTARQQAIDAAYGQSTSRLDPQWDKRQEAQRTQLLNQGLDPSSEAYKSAMQDFGLQRNDAYSSAMNNAISQGTQAGHTAFQDNLTAYNNPLQDMEQIKLLSAQQTHPELLNAYIAQQNAALKQRSDLMQQQTGIAEGGMNLAGNMLGSLY
jgi:hypothetical protein